MNELAGKPAVWHTIERLAGEYCANVITIAAPAFDEGGFDTLLSDKVTAYYGFDDSPLKRLLAVTEQLPNDALVIRVDGLNFCVDTESIDAMLKLADGRQLDLIKFRDDWPPIFCADIYRVGALRKMIREIGDQSSSDARFHIHPKYYLLESQDRYRCERFSPEKYSNELLAIYREKAKKVYNERDLGDGKSHAVSAGDSLAFHYRLAIKHLSRPGKALDIACGLGYGTSLLAEVCDAVVGADVDPGVIAKAAGDFPESANLSFEVADCEALPFENNEFDAVISFETIEHVNADKYLAEMDRILTSGGVFIISTPQNAIGQIPVNPWHNKEYSLDEIKELVSRYFAIDKVIGIKQGTVFFEDDPVGTNTVLICHKSE